jgi:hypothetical protein
MTYQTNARGIPPYFGILLTIVSGQADPLFTSASLFISEDIKQSGSRGGITPLRPVTIPAAPAIGAGYYLLVM